MAIGFRNVRTNERIRVDNPHLIAAYINSSDMHVNAGQGQDFGWRLSAEDVARIDALKADTTRLEEVARFLGKPVGDIRQVDFVKYVSHLDDVADQVKINQSDDKPAYQEQYEAELAEARKKMNAKAETKAAGAKNPKK